MLVTADQVGRHQAGDSCLTISLEKRNESRDLFRGSPAADGYEAEGCLSVTAYVELSSDLAVLDSARGCAAQSLGHWHSGMVLRVDECAKRVDIVDNPVQPPL